MGDSLITIVAIFLAAILMFVFPLATISEMNDNEATAMVQSYTTEFVNNIRSKGKVTKEDYDAFVQKLYATGNSYDVDFELQIADTNPGKKTATQQIGDTTYYSVFTSQVESELNSDKHSYLLKEGDYVIVYVKNTNTTISQMIKSVLYSITGNQSYVIMAQDSGGVVATGY